MSIALVAFIILVAADVTLYGIIKKMDPTLKPTFFSYLGSGFLAFFSYLKKHKK
jgi:hypothetical protein